MLWYRYFATMKLFLPLIFLTAGALCFPGQKDEVKSLPGLNSPINFRHYSGYLESIKKTYVHYWFFESQTGNSHQDPVVVYLNGGPGCSSLLGEMLENGPLQYQDVNTITVNPYAWNKKVNVLYLESPAGVGFTYRVNQTDYTTDDAETAQVNFGALQAFFKKFPHLLYNDFYLTGESYAGFYIPTLSMVLLDKNFPENFKGIAIGDGLLDWDIVPHAGSFVSNYHKMMRNRRLGDESDWLNRDDVKKALHIDPTFSGEWEECNGNVLETYQEFKNHDMTRQLKRIINKGTLKTLIYHGEQDPLIPWKGNKQYVNKLGYKNITAFVPWTYNGKEAGFTEKYEGDLTFTSFHAAGHMVPENKPGPAYQVINQYLFEN